MEIFEDRSMPGSIVLRDEKETNNGGFGRTDRLFVCLRGGTLLALIKERRGVVFAFVVVVAGVDYVSCRLSSVVVVVVVRSGLKVLWPNGPGTRV
jgi:hypothetical protein